MTSSFYFSLQVVVLVIWKRMKPTRLLLYAAVEKDAGQRDRIKEGILCDRRR